MLGQHTGKDHEEAVGHDEDFHGVEQGAGWKNATVGDDVVDELGIEYGTEPEDGNGVHDESPFIRPVEPVGRLVVQDGLVLDNGDGEAAGDCEECDDQRQSKDAVFDILVPESDHCPCLDHEHDLDEDDDDEG